MKQQISAPLVAGIVIVLIAVIAVFGYKMLNSPKNSMSAAEQKESMRHMIPVNGNK